MPPYLPLLLFALLALGCAICLGRLLWHHPYHLWIFEHGLLVERRTAPVVLPWATLQQIEMSIDRAYGETYLNLTLEHGQAKPVRIRTRFGKQAMPDLSRQVPHIAIEEVIDVIAKATQAYRLEVAQARYRAGEQVDFKTLQVSAEGLCVKRVILPWSEVSGLLTGNEDRTLAIMRAGQQRPWKVVWIEHIPNRDILPLLIASYQPQFVAPVPEHVTISKCD